MVMFWWFYLVFVGFLVCKVGLWCLLLNEDEVEVKVNVKGVPSYQLE